MVLMLSLNEIMLRLHSGIDIFLSIKTFFRVVSLSGNGLREEEIRQRSRM